MAGFSRGGQRILLSFVANWRRFAQILSLIQLKCIHYQTLGKSFIFSASLHCLPIVYCSSLSQKYFVGIEFYTACQCLGQISREACHDPSVHFLEYLKIL